MSQSLTGQLFLRVTPIVLGTLVCMAVIAFFSCRREIDYVRDVQMANDGKVLWSLAADELADEDYESLREIEYGTDASDMPLWDGEADDFGSARVFRIWDGDRILMRSENALSPQLPRQEPGFKTITYQGVAWRIYTMRVGDGNIALDIGEKQSLRDALVWNILLDVFLPLLVAIPIIGLGLWMGIRKGIRPVQALVRQIQSRHTDDLTELEAPALPKELRPLGFSINALLGKLRQSLSAERRFADHAAHQLRTPLAGSRLLIQMLGEADSEAERQAILTDLAESNQRASELVRKLLLAARVSHQPIALREMPVYPVAARALAELAPIAQEKDIALQLGGEADAQVLADETLLSLMLSNIVDNAIKYTPAGGRVELHVAADGDGCRITVSDTGPGIAEHWRDQVFQRFYRLEETVEGTGLGLSIVAEVVKRFNGQIMLSTPHHGAGLLVDIRLPNSVNG